MEGEQQASTPPSKSSPPSSNLSLDGKWDACYDILLRRFVYSSVAGAASALLLFRSPTTRWATVAFGAGLGLGSAYTDCSYVLGGSLLKPPESKTSSHTPPPSSPSAS